MKGKATLYGLSWIICLDCHQLILWSIFSDWLCLAILNSWQTASEQFSAFQIDTHCCAFSCERTRSCTLRKRCNLRLTFKDLIDYSRMNKVTTSTWRDQSTCLASEVFDRSIHHSDLTLSVDWLLFWALTFPCLINFALNTYFIYT